MPYRRSLQAVYILQHRPIEYVHVRLPVRSGVLAAGVGYR
jgi:hypothetical protein